MSPASTALQGSPTEVLAGAGRLGSDARLMRELGERWGTLAAAGLAGAGWSGSASLLAAARTAQLGSALRDGATGLARVEGGARVYGGQLATTQERVRGLVARRAEAEGELVLLLRLPRPDPDPVAELRLQRQIEQLREVITRLLAEQEREESLIERARGIFAEVLAWRPPPIVQELLALREDLPGIGNIVRGTLDLAKGAVTTFHSVRALLSTSVDDFLTHAARAQRWVARILPKPGDLRFLRWVKLPVLTVFDSIKGLIDGGGYEGPRGIVHRSLSGVGLVGLIGGGAGIVIGAPVLIGLGAVAVGGFTVWTIGNMIWDHRDAIGTVVRKGWNRVKRFGRWLFGQRGPTLGEIARRAVETMPLPPPVRDDGFAPPSVRRPPCGNERPIPLYAPVRDITCDWGPWVRPGPAPRFWSWPWPGILRVPLLPWGDLMPGARR